MALGCPCVEALIIAAESLKFGGETVEATSYYLRLWRQVHRGSFALTLTLTLALSTEIPIRAPNPFTQVHAPGLKTALSYGNHTGQSCNRDPRLFQGAGSSYVEVPASKPETTIPAC